MRIDGDIHSFQSETIIELIPIYIYKPLSNFFIKFK